MKLKKLEIVGFKSFLDKVKIDFPPGIAAVVGPNGCGKSNIVDALRWVMGEQSVKQLRGKSMEDVIFAGADGKSPLNMAEVSLTLANDNGSAPEELKDFSEIMITRRQYRSGERMYFLNRQPCRLKDIHNIFWGSGMGARSYSVIQQGNIGAITDAGPEERRYFIEEAAGVTRYKNRKNEALRKVNATHQNILRINDIIAEVKRQMNALQRQAQKAERYKSLQTRIRKLEIRAAGFHYDTLEQQISEARALLKELKDADMEQASRLTRLDAAIEEVKLARTRKGQEIAEQKSRLFEAQRNADKIENDLAHYNNDLESLHDEIEGLETAAGELEHKNKQIAEEIALAENERRQLAADIENEKQVLKEKNAAAGAVQDELSALNSRLEAEKKSLMQLVADEARYKNIHQNATNNKDSLKRRLRRIDEEVILAGNQVKDCEAAEAEAKAEHETLQQEHADAGTAVTAFETDLDERRKTLAECVKAVQTTAFERGKVKSRHAALVKMEQSFEWYRDGVKAVMKRNADLAGTEGETSPGILGLIADVIAPESGYETAVESVLGEAMQYILVSEQTAGLDAIDYLQTQNAGRGGFIPVGKMKTLNGRPPRIPDAASSLLDCVSVKEGFEAVAEAMLANVLVTGDLDTALGIWNQSNGDGPYAVVTRDGDVITAGGVIIGGSKDKLDGILLKKQEIRDLEQQLAELDATLAAGHQRQTELENIVRGLEADLQQAVAKRNQLQQMAVEAEKNVYRAGEDLKHGRRRLEVVQLEQEQLMGEESDVDDEIARYNEAIERIEADVAGSQQTVAETTNAIEAVSGRLAAFNQAAVDIKLRLSTLNAKLDNSRNTLRRLEDFKDDGLKRFEQLNIEIDQKKRRRMIAEEKVYEYNKKLPSMYAEMKTMEETLEANEADFRVIENQLKENDEIVGTIQHERQETLEKIRYLEIEQSQREMKQENILKRMEEKYHHSLDRLRSEIAPSETDETVDIEKIESKLAAVREKIAKIGDVNLGAIHEYEELKDRFEFLNTQRDDLLKALDDLQKVIRKINRITQDRFMDTFHLINEKLNEVFPRLFSGGTAKLVLTEPNNPLETGVELMIHPPGKNLTRLSLLSGGEKALSAIAFIFAIFLIKPASFCLMDEIDAPLDEANVYRFNELLKIIGEKSQIVMITHNKKSMEFADVLFGVTMEKKGISKIVSVNLERPN